MTEAVAWTSSVFTIYLPRWPTGFYSVTKSVFKCKFGLAPMRPIRLVEFVGKSPFAVVVVPALADNYSYLVVDGPTGQGNWASVWREAAKPCSHGGGSRGPPQNRQRNQGQLDPVLYRNHPPSRVP